MTTSTDAQLRTRSHLCDEALAAINAQRTRRSITPAATLDEFRDEAYRLILISLRGRSPSISGEDISRPDDLIDAECACTLWLLYTAASSRPDDVFALNAATWHARYTSALASASPVDDTRGTGRSFGWSRR